MLIRENLKSALAKSPAPVQGFVARILAIYRDRQYPGKTLRSDTLFGAKLYLEVNKLLQFIWYRRYRALGRRLPRPAPDARIPSDGFLVLRGVRSVVLAEAIRAAEDAFQKLDIERLARSAGKRFLIRDLLDLRRPENWPIAKLACDPLILAPVTDYLGMAPVLGLAKLMYSPNESFEGRSQLFHFDGEDYRNIKVFINLTDVDENSGPLTILNSVDSHKVYSELRRNRVISAGMANTFAASSGRPATARNRKFFDETVFEIVDKRAAIQLTGPKGTIAMVDTCQCYHFGSRPGSRPRLLLNLHYYTPFSADMPIYGRRNHGDDFSEISGVDSEVVRLVLGFTHMSYSLRRLTRRRLMADRTLERSN